MQKEINIREDSRELFHSKILLFGEYSIIFGSMALSIPFGHYSARFSFFNKKESPADDFSVRSNAMLREYCSWLEITGKKGDLKGLLNTDAFKRDLDKGMFLESDIPQGYGLGSSGALCAAVYDRYAVEKIDNSPPAGYDEIRQLKKIFSAMESWFHGTSSGTDPLNCYFRRPLLVEAGGKISVTDIPRYNGGEGAAIFLLNTGGPGKTEPMVRLFMDKCKDQRFLDEVNSVMIPAVNGCIGSLMKPDVQLLMKNLKTLSVFQIENMQAMIPADFMDFWGRGLASGSYYLKLCGSGGGGFLLGFTRDMEKTSDILNRNKLKPLHVHLTTVRQG